MFRWLISALLAVVLAAPDSLAIAQDVDTPSAKTKKRTLKYADTDTKPVQGTEVVRPAQSSGLMSWRPDVSSLPAKGYPDITVIAESIELRTQGRMRWTFAVYNKGESRNFIFHLGRSYLADEQGETYKPVAQEFPPNYGEFNRLGLLEGTKKRFWLEFKAPVRPTYAFRVGMILEGGFSTQFNAFAPFLVTLEKPLFYDNGVFRLENGPKDGAVAGEDVDGGRPAAQPPQPKLTRLGTLAKRSKSKSSPGTNPTPIDPEELAAIFVELSEKGLTVNGSIQPRSGGSIPGRIVFMRRSLDNLVEARIVTTGKGVAINCEVVGAFLEDLSTPSGLALKMFDFVKVRYRFTLDGNNLDGEDSLGNKYHFIISTK